MASSDGRPSRRKNEPGIRPTAYIRSSTSTVSGRSQVSSGCFDAVVAESTTVSPSSVTTAEPPAAWRAADRLEPDLVYAKCAVIDSGFGTKGTLHG